MTGVSETSPGGGDRGQVVKVTFPSAQSSRMWESENILSKQKVARMVSLMVNLAQSRVTWVESLTEGD